MLPVKEFFEKFEEYKPEKEDESKSIKYYKAQSCNSSLKDKPLEILYEIDEDLEDDWIQNINKGLKSISAHAPGINFTQYSDANNKICSYRTFRIKFCKNDKYSVYTQGNIYDEKVCLIFLSNKWTNQRFGTAMHETLHTIGFKHEHCRKDRDEYVDVYSSDY